MVRTRMVVGIVLLLSLLVASPAASAVADDVGIEAPVDPVLAQEEGEEEEGGIEGAIEGFIEAQGTVGAVIVLLGGALLLAASTEKLISYLARAALNLKMSLFALAIIFTGFEFDDTILALVLSAGGLEEAALGSALGTGLAIIGVTLALAALVEPFPVDLPNDYVAIFGLAPLILVPFVLLGTLTAIHGIVLTAFFVFAFGYFIVRERRRDVPVFRNTDLGKQLRPDGGTATRADALDEIAEERILGDLADSGIVWIVLSILALVGIVFAAMLLEGGSGVVMEGFGLSGTVFGATILTLILTFEDIMLTLEPVRRGFPEIGVGNVIGSVLFSVTGNIGVIMFLSEVSISSSVLTFHLPFMIVVTALAAYFFYEGQIERWHGALLGGLYVAYWVIALVVFSGVPIGE
ncbi:sodium:calcium antiporter [Haloplanus halophilus]|uniref:sodium:calcium antiporter n=1 Tax=Haloplanus halophilus TaxID=2949993 RepID=UPI00203DF7BD|nr:sodium:proton exchanger [Haloplanus sp. GDY1]